MPGIAIVTDSTCDIPIDLAERWNISIVPCYINFGNKSYLDRIELSREEFYTRLISSDTLPTTAAPPPGMFAEVYRKVLKSATGIVSIHPPDKFSALRQSAINGWDQVEGNIPFRALDSGQICMGLGWVALLAAQAAAQWADMDTIEALVRDLRKRVHLFASLSTIKYLRQSGRVGWARGAIGQLLRLRPMLHLYDGEIYSMGNTRTFSNAMQKLVNELDNLSPVEQITILHTEALDKADIFKQKVESLYQSLDMMTINATPILGTHVGPEAIGFVAIQKLNT
ncbi:MAG: DegV family protein [Anaerolineales bacterium]|nr:DegV family protein [Anaerolineales bacterium]